MRLASILALVVVAGLAGCGPDFNVASVSGRVTLNGKPLENAFVNFQPDNGPNPGPGASGKTDNEGRYTLAIKPGEFGAVIGKNLVRISTLDIAGERVIQPELVPHRYHALQSELRFDVTSEGTSEADFELTSP